MKKRLLEICDATNNSQSSLSLKLGQSRGFIKQCSDSCNSNVLSRLIALYPNLNPYYIITGQGEMWIDGEKDNKLQKLAADNIEYKLLYQQMKSLYESSVKSYDTLRNMYCTLEEQNKRLIETLSKYEKSSTK